MDEKGTGAGLAPRLSDIAAMALPRCVMVGEGTGKLRTVRTLQVPAGSPPGRRCSPQFCGAHGPGCCELASEVVPREGPAPALGGT